MLKAQRKAYVPFRHAPLLLRANAVTPSSTLDPIKLLKLSADTKNLKIVNQVSIAHNLFDRMPERNVVSWSALMTGYLLNGFSLKVITLLKDMVSEANVSPNEYIFAIAISSCCDRGRLEEDAMGVWNEVPVNDIVAYNSILSRLVENGYLMEGLEVLRNMVSESLEWDKVTFVNAFSLCASLKNLRLGLHVHGKMLTSGVECDAYVSSAIINMYGKCGKSLMARGLFNGLQSRNVVLWTAVMAAYFQNGCFEEALNLFSKMEQENVKSNEFTHAVLLNACAGLSALRNGSLLHGHSEKSGFKHHVMVGNALINMYAKSGDIEAAKNVFSDMMHRDIITWNAMICGFSHHGLGKKTLLVFYDMLAAEENPNYVTFTGVLSACGHLGLVQEGFYYLHHLMKQFGVQPWIGTLYLYC
ncbi:hypothetical protein OIU85_007599 [Salix viminalis]|uniref:Pentacotripeptide-repeat region of PRORP domain-containing protein n=1 Tax=Salix viminalis TaxID=40686 RepID=A0A9Q0P9F8_SALVM|nr:hypothetical protein OIU85_007599 [Salix viminalis]